MSFWDNNKDTFKAVGKSTVKGIGRGSAALGKAGYRTYKNSSNKNKDIPDEDPVANLPPLPAPASDLKSYPAPPKRTVPTLSTSENESTPPSTLAQSATSYQSQPANGMAHYNSGVQLGTQPGLQYQRPIPQPQTSTIPVPPPRSLPQPGLASEPPTNSPALFQPTPNTALPTRNLASDAIDVASSTGTLPINEPEQPKKPLPDASSFAPPPIHRNRGSSPSSSTQSTYGPKKLSASTKEPPKLPRKTNLMDFNVNDCGPPPPAPFRPDRNSSNSNTHPSISRMGSSTSGVSAHTVPPPPPPRSSNTTPSVRPTPPPPYASVDDEDLEQPPRLPSRNKSTSPLTSPHPPPARSVRSISPKVNDTSVDRNSITQTTSKKLAPPKPVKKSSLTKGNADTQNPPSKEFPALGIGIGERSGFSNVANEMSQRLAARFKIEDANQESNTVKPPIGKPQSQSQSQPQPQPQLKPKPKAFEPKSESAMQYANKSEIPIIRPKPQNNTDYKTDNESTIISPKPKISPPVKRKPQVLSKPQNLQTKIKDDSPNPQVNTLSTSQVTNPPIVESTPTSSPPPPPPRNYRTQSQEPPNFDLEISTGWFSKFSEISTLPRAFKDLIYTTSCVTSNRTTSSGQVTLNSRNISFMFPDLSVISYRILWENDNYKEAKAEIEKYIPSLLLAIPSKETLLESHLKFSEYIASWCEHKMGQKVGNGECWTLAHDALSKGCGNHAFVSIYRHHGFPILRLRGNGNNQALVEGSELDTIRRGDILQFDRSVFIDKTNNLTQTAGDPDHTSVVLENTGSKLIVAEQNVNGQKIVRKGEVCLNNLYLGTVVVYRVMPASWKPEM